jgi:hypothetical protein
MMPITIRSTWMEWQKLMGQRSLYLMEPALVVGRLSEVRNVDGREVVAEVDGASC